MNLGFDLQRFAINQVRDRLEGYEVFVEGTRKLGTADVTLPELKYKTETLSGAGIGGDIEMGTPGQTESMELGLTWRTINEDGVSLMAMQSHDLELRGANQHYDAGTGKFIRHAVKINVRGIPKSGNLGKFEMASRSDMETTLEALYLKITMDGKKMVEIDKLNYIHYIDGVDYLEGLRQALGL